MKKYSLYILFLMGLGAMAGSCTNLDEKIYDRLVDNNFYKNEKSRPDIAIFVFTET